jgi:choline-sulfatase
MQPNILLLISDQHNYKVLGCYGNNLIKTPNLDLLANQGTVFENCYCNSPLCVPSRLSFTRGQYISNAKVWSNSCILENDWPSIAWALRGVGYNCYLCGKMDYSKGRLYGFEELGKSFTNKSKNRKFEVCPKRDILCSPIIGGGFDFGFKSQKHRSKGNAGHDEKITKKSCDFLANYKGDKPFFLTVGFLQPHPPLTVPDDRYWEMYIDEVPMPHVRDFCAPGNLRCHLNKYKKIRKDENIIRKGRAIYYGQVTWLDERIGEIIKTLDSNKYCKNTMVIYTSDHGEGMGEHGLWGKMMMYEDAVHVPLIIRHEYKSRIAKVCSLVDLTQTIVEIAGANIPSSDGRSLMTLLEGTSYWDNFAISQMYSGFHSGITMLREDNYKYIYHSKTEEKELYDLNQDDKELNNIDDDRITARMHMRIKKILKCDPRQIERNTNRSATPHSIKVSKSFNI